MNRVVYYRHLLQRILCWNTLKHDSLALVSQWSSSSHVINEVDHLVVLVGDEGPEAFEVDRYSIRQVKIRPFSPMP